MTDIKETIRKILFEIFDSKDIYPFKKDYFGKGENYFFKTENGWDYKVGFTQPESKDYWFVVFRAKK